MISYKEVAKKIASSVLLPGVDWWYCSFAHQISWRKLALFSLDYGGHKSVFCSIIIQYNVSIKDNHYKSVDYK